MTYINLNIARKIDKWILRNFWLKKYADLNINSNVTSVW